MEFLRSKKKLLVAPRNVDCFLRLHVRQIIRIQIRNNKIKKNKETSIIIPRRDGQAGYSPKLKTVPLSHTDSLSEMNYPTDNPSRWITLVKNAKVLGALQDSILQHPKHPTALYPLEIWEN